MDSLFGLVIGILLTAILFIYVRSQKSKKLASSQSIILLDKIKSVCKFITVEGDFAEIYHYADVKQKFLRLVSSKKKALIIINAKTHIGFDLSKINIESNVNNKTIILNHFPKAEILSIETNLNYYSKTDGYFNKFEASDLTDLQEAAKKHIKDKIPESGLFQEAHKEVLEAISLIENIVQTIGWKLDYSALKIDKKEKNLSH